MALSGAAIITGSLFHSDPGYPASLPLLTGTLRIPLLAEPSNMTISWFLAGDLEHGRDGVVQFLVVG
jgi:hypothetical protein